MKELSKYEGKLPFNGSPSADLTNLEHIEQSQIDLLEKRIKEKEKHEIQEENKQFIIENMVEKTKPNLIKKEAKSQHTYMSAYDIEQFAKECNAFVVREERKKKE